MRADVQVRADVVAELDWDASINLEDIAIAVKDGVVTLAGDRRHLRPALRRRARRRAGAGRAGESRNDLTVKLPGAMERSDADIAHAAVLCFGWQRPTVSRSRCPTDG